MLYEVITWLLFKRGTMKNILFLPVLACMFILTACQGNKDKSYSGEIMLSSELFGSSSYYVQGYSFESEEFVSYPGTSPAPDILVENLREPGGDIVAAGFSSPGNSKAFLLHGSYNSAAEAESAYES